MGKKTAARSAGVERRATDLLAMSRRALWPLVKLLVQRGVAYPALAEVMKEAFVLVALREFPLEGKRETDSRISLLTGIHRRDVKRLRERSLARAQAATPPQRNEGQDLGLAERVAAMWGSQPEYLDRRGRPKPLARRADDPGEPSFDALVEAVSKDIRPRALLDEWLRSGVVTRDAKGLMRLRQQVLKRQRDADHSFGALTSSIHDHLAAVVEVLAPDDSHRLDGYLTQGNLSDDSVVELGTLATAQAQRALQAVEQRGKRLSERDAHREATGRRVSFGVYFYSSPKRAGEPPTRARSSRPTTRKR